MGYRIRDIITKTLNELNVISDIKEYLIEYTDVYLYLTNDLNKFRIAFYNDKLDICINFDFRDKINDNMAINILKEIFTNYPANNGYPQTQKLINLLNEKGIEIYNNWKKEME